MQKKKKTHKKPLQRTKSECLKRQEQHQQRKRKCE